MEQMLVENLKNKWEPVLNCEGMAPIQDNYRKNVTAILLENQEKALKEEANTPLVLHQDLLTPMVHLAVLPLLTLL